MAKDTKAPAAALTTAAAKVAETGLFKSHRPSKGSRQTSGKVRKDAGGNELFELRVRCIRDGGTRGFVLDGYGDDGTPGQQTAQAIRSVSAVDEDGLPVFFLDAAAKDHAFAVKGLASGFEVKKANAEILEKMALNVAARSDEAADARDIVSKALDEKVKGE